MSRSHLISSASSFLSFVIFLPIVSHCVCDASTPCRKSSSVCGCGSKYPKAALSLHCFSHSVVLSLSLATHTQLWWSSCNIDSHVVLPFPLCTSLDWIFFVFCSFSCPLKSLEDKVPRCSFKPIIAHFGPCDQELCSVMYVFRPGPTLLHTFLLSPSPLFQLLFFPIISAFPHFCLFFSVLYLPFSVFPIYPVCLTFTSVAAVTSERSTVQR